ncbi:MAG: ATP-binding cassette domain-containing protein [Tissierellia bacterium]|nr:ATP-binding cassette domain-containing protein [Tissierellia bacterium]
MNLSVDITEHYKDFSLKINFESDGNPLGILGSSGSGISMTLKCIAGIITPDKGKIVVNGKTLFDSQAGINVKPQKRRIGYLFQNYALFPNMTVKQNVACGMSESGKKKDKKIAALIKGYGLNGLENRYPSQLSGGQQQRVALIRILAYEPEVLLLDEPFSALDFYLKEALQIEMMKLLAEYKGQAIMVTHNRDEAYKICQNLMIIDTGQVQAFGPSDDMFAKPTKLIAAQLTGCRNFSRASKIGPNKVRAIDWDMDLFVKDPIPDGLTHVGIRAHYFLPTSWESQENTIPVRIVERIESPFEWNVLFQNANASSKATANMWWKYPKGNKETILPEFLYVPPENVLLLEE